MRTACIYHKGDLDGFCSAAIVRVALRDPVQLIPLEHGDCIPWELLEDVDRVFVVDFSLAPFAESMPKLQSMVPKLIWIDHHKSAIQTAQEIGLSLEGKQECGKAACELCWEYFYGDEAAMPLAVRLLGRYDVWDHAADPRVEQFQLGMQAKEHANPIDPKSEDFWIDMFFANAQTIDRIAEEGKIILSHRQVTYRLLQTQMHTLSFAGHTWIALNTQKTGSKVFEGVYDSESHYGCVVYFRSVTGSWIVSLYSLDNRHDLSIIAKEHGGGGHASACGFQLDHSEFDLFIRGQM